MKKKTVFTRKTVIKNSLSLYLFILTEFWNLVELSDFTNTEFNYSFKIPRIPPLIVSTSGTVGVFENLLVNFFFPRYSFVLYGEYHKHPKNVCFWLRKFLFSVVSNRSWRFSTGLLCNFYDTLPTKIKGLKKCPEELVINLEYTSFANNFQIDVVWQSTSQCQIVVQRRINLEDHQKKIL